MSRNRLIFVVLLMLLPALQAHAVFDWWLIYGWGERPSRVLMFADADSVREQQTDSGDAAGILTVVQVSTELVYEAASSPDSVKYTHQVDCRNGTLREYVVSTLHRDSTVETTPGDHAWRQSFLKPEPDAWQARAIEFACDRSARTRENGMVYIGSDEIHPSFIAWKLWPDGSNPGFTSTRSNAEIQADNEARLEQLQSRVDSQYAELQGLLALDQEIEARRTARMARWPKRGIQRAIHEDLLEPYIGRSEEDLIARFGYPFRTFDRPGSRLLYFAYGHDVVTSGNRGVLGYGETGRQEWRCYVTYELKGDKAVDYVVSGNYCVESLGG